MKKLLVIGWVWPEPNSSAAGSHMMQMLECFLTADYQITFASAAQLSDHMVDLNDYSIAVEQIQLNCDSFDTFLQSLQPDVVIFDRYMVEEQFGWRVAKNCPDAVRVIDTEDLQSLRYARHELAKKQLPIAEIIANADLTTELAQREVAAILRSDLSLMVSTAEIELLIKQYQVPKSHLNYLPFIFKQNDFPQIAKTFEQRIDFVSIGNFRHAPNWDAVLYLKQQIWPKIRKQLPQANLCVYGAYPPKKATDLYDEKSGFLVKGWAESAFEVIENARVLLAPLRFGAGIKGKLAEAMLLATPSVTTSIGAEGMRVSDDKNKVWAGAIADTVDGFVTDAVALYQDQNLWQQASDRATLSAQQLFTLPEFGQNLIKQIEYIQQNLAEHRNSNFVGLMLNHHHQRSTQFMSQWIEVKTKLAEVSEN